MNLFLTHDGGCGGATSDSVTLCNLLAGYINNPNVAGNNFWFGMPTCSDKYFGKINKKNKSKINKPIIFMSNKKAVLSQSI